MIIKCFIDLYLPYFRWCLLWRQLIKTSWRTTDRWPQQHDTWVVPRDLCQLQVCGGSIRPSMLLWRRWAKITMQSSMYRKLRYYVWWILENECLQEFLSMNIRILIDILIRLLFNKQSIALHTGLNIFWDFFLAPTRRSRKANVCCPFSSSLSRAINLHYSDLGSSQFPLSCLLSVSQQSFGSPYHT